MGNKEVVVASDDYTCLIGTRPEKPPRPIADNAIWDATWQSRSSDSLVLVSFAHTR